MFFSFFIFTYSCCCFFCILIICCSLSRSGIISILLWFITIITFFCWWCWVFSITCWRCRRIFSTTCWRCRWISFTSFFIIIFLRYINCIFRKFIFRWSTYEIFPSFFIYFCAFGEESNVVFNLSATIGLNVQF